MQVSNLVGHNNNLATGLEHEAGECVRGIVSALHPGGDVVRVREKLYVGWEGKRLEIDEVLLATDGSCAYVVEAENVLTESSGDEMQKRLDVIQCVLHAPMSPPWRLYAGVADAQNAWATHLLCAGTSKTSRGARLSCASSTASKCTGCCAAAACSSSSRRRASPRRRRWWRTGRRAATRSCCPVGSALVLPLRRATRSSAQRNSAARSATMGTGRQQQRTTHDAAPGARGTDRTFSADAFRGVAHARLATMNKDAARTSARLHVLTFPWRGASTRCCRCA